MRKFVILACLAAVSGVAAAEQAKSTIIVTPFERLAEHPGCPGPERIAIRAAFDVKHALARFGDAGRDKDSQSCEIKTRRGDKVSSIEIPCPEDGKTAPREAAAVRALPRAVDLAGEAVICLGATDLSFVEASWRMQAMTEGETFTAQGDLSSEGLIMVYRGQASRLSSGPDRRQHPPVLAILWNRVKLGPVDGVDVPLDMSAYLVLSPEMVQDSWCNKQGCKSYDSTAEIVVRTIGGYGAGNLVDFVNGGEQQ